MPSPSFRFFKKKSILWRYAFNINPKNNPKQLQSLRPMPLKPVSFSQISNRFNFAFARSWPHLSAATCIFMGEWRHRREVWIALFLPLVGIASQSVWIALFCR